MGGWVRTSHMVIPLNWPMIAPLTAPHQLALLQDRHAAMGITAEPMRTPEVYITIDHMNLTIISRILQLLVPAQHSTAKCQHNNITGARMGQDWEGGEEGGHPCQGTPSRG